MTKLQILSDTHNEFFGLSDYKRSDNGLWACEIPKSDSDIIILAGDIDKGVKGVEWAINESTRLGKLIVYIPGNHEYYGFDLPKTLSSMRDITQGTDVHILNNDSLILDKVRILGTTLWTDYEADYKTNQNTAMSIVANSLNDHRLIRYNDALFTPDKALELHTECREWLIKKLNEPFDGSTVVVTHHGPSAACQHKDFPLSPISSAFHSNMDDIVAMADLWVYGHTHSCLDTLVHGTRLISNQFGYAYREENNDFDPYLTVDISNLK